MSQLRVPRVHIVIPSKHTSRHRFEPRYYLPLFQAEHQAMLDDPSNPVHEDPHPADAKDKAFYWMEIESVDVEYGRCRGMFPRVFPLVYPKVEDFYSAVEREMDRGTEIEAAITRALRAPEEIDVEIPEWLKKLDVKGLDDEKRRNMVMRGLDSPAAVQKMDRIKLAEIVGARLSKTLKAATEGATEAPEADVAIARRIPAPVAE